MRREMRSIKKQPWKILLVPVMIPSYITETVMEETTEQYTELVEETQVVTRGATMTPHEISAMYDAAEMYYQAVKTGGDNAYKTAQAEQAKYELFLIDYIKSQMPR